MGKLKVLSFGHIPTWAGGRQTQGAANVIYNLALNMSKFSEAKVYLGVTDVFKEFTRVGNLTICGWTRKSLIKYIILHPCISLAYLINLIIWKRKIGSVINIMRMFLKGIHLRHCIDLVNPDVVQLHGIDAGTFIKIVPNEVNVIVTLHGIFGKDQNIRECKSISRIENAIWHSIRINKIYLISRQLVSDFTSTYGNCRPPYEVILNAYNDDYFKYHTSIEHDCLTICTVASMSDRKGQERVLDGLIKSGCHCRYICVGSVDNSISLRMTNKVQGTNVCLEILGPKEPELIRKILAMSDYMILPSSSEGFGLVFLESIACGTPIILPKNLPICEEEGIIKPFENAILLDDCTSNAISTIIPKLQEHLFDRKNVSNTIVNFTWYNIARKYLDSFNKLIDK